MDFEPITTQEEFDAAIEARLEQERETIRGQYTTQVNDLQNQVTTYQTNETKMRVAHETGLPYEVAHRLTGANEEEIRADAESLKRLLNLQIEEPMRSNEPTSMDVNRAALRGMLQNMKGV